MAKNILFPGEELQFLNYLEYLPLSVSVLEQIKSTYDEENPKDFERNCWRYICCLKDFYFHDVELSANINKNKLPKIFSQFSMTASASLRAARKNAVENALYKHGLKNREQVEEALRRIRNGYSY